MLPATYFHLIGEQQIYILKPSNKYKLNITPIALVFKTGQYF